MVRDQAMFLVSGESQVLRMARGRALELRLWLMSLRWHLGIFEWRKRLVVADGSVWSRDFRIVARIYTMVLSEIFADLRPRDKVLLGSYWLLMETRRGA